MIVVVRFWDSEIFVLDGYRYQLYEYGGVPPCGILPNIVNEEFGETVK